jgi:hypothetical protein
MKSSVKKEIRGKRQNKIHFDLGLDFWHLYMKNSYMKLCANQMSE